jgi:hypothetical protein
VSRRKPRYHLDDTMQISWYPRNLVTGLLLLAALALALNVAVDAHRGAIIGLFALAVCVIVDLLFTINPASWSWPEKRRGSGSARS